MSLISGRVNLLLLSSKLSLFVCFEVLGSKPRASHRVSHAFYEKHSRSFPCDFRVRHFLYSEENIPKSFEH